VTARDPVSRFVSVLADYARRVWDNSAEDNIFFLAGGVAFSLLLAGVPFVLLLTSAFGFVLNQTPATTSNEVRALIDALLPPHAETVDNPIHRILDEVVRARGAVGFYSALGFVWFTTRLFGSLRSALADVFDVQNERGIIAGKLFDVRITILATTLALIWITLSAYLAIATSRGIALLASTGLRQEVMGGLEYTIGRIIAFSFLVWIFFALYKYLPNRKIRWQPALVGALSASVLFEVARNLFTAYARSFNVGSLYTGTLVTIVSIVFWVYYAALIFILGGEVGQAHGLRMTRRLQREMLD
jgi:membrane protein